MDEYQSPDRWVKIGSVCNKSGGHFAFVGEEDYGCCGSHYSADVFIVPKKGYRHPDYTEFETQLGEQKDADRERSWGSE